MQLRFSQRSEIKKNTVTFGKGGARIRGCLYKKGGGYRFYGLF